MQIPDQSRSYIFGDFQLHLNPSKVAPKMVQLGSVRGVPVFLEMNTNQKLAQLRDRINEVLNATED